MFHVLHELHLSYHYGGGVSSTSHCFMETCPVLQLSVFGGDVPCPSAVVTRIIEEICCMHFSNKL